jgi:hypothetical protein
MAIYRVQRQFGPALDIFNIPGVPENMRSPVVPGANSGASTVANNTTIPFKPGATGTDVSKLRDAKIFENGQNSVGAWQGLKNTYKNAGTMGKAGMIGAGVLGTGLMVKGLMGSGGSKKEVAFSDDTGADFREAAIISGLGASTIGIGLMAKHGLLGKTGKKTYEAAAKKVKTIWNEAKTPNPKKGEVVSETIEKGSKSGTTATTEKIIKESGKPDRVTVETTARKVKFAPEDWSKVLKVIKEKGMDPSNPAHKLAAAKIAGVKPVSVK